MIGGSDPWQAPAWHSCVPVARCCPLCLSIFPVVSRFLCVVHVCARFQRPETVALAQDPAKNITHFHGSGAFRSHAAMSVDQAHQRLGIAEGVIQGLQEQLQRVTAGHQAALEALQTIHQEMNLLRNQMEVTSRVRLVEPKSLMPDRFGKKNGPSWRTWSYLARDFVGVVHTALKEAMKNAENRQHPIAATHLQHDFGVTNEMDQELQHLDFKDLRRSSGGCPWS